MPDEDIGVGIAELRHGIAPFGQEFELILAVTRPTEERHEDVPSFSGRGGERRQAQDCPRLIHHMSNVRCCTPVGVIYFQQEQDCWLLNRQIRFIRIMKF